MIKFSAPETEHLLKPRITVFGVGGAGGNAVNNMIAAGLEGVDFVAANTDVQALQANSAPRKLQLGTSITQGLGAGARPEVGRAAAEEAIDDIMATLDGSHMVFIAAGMGGGTGTGAAPVIARLARDSGILTVGVVTKPFAFEGKHRMKLAESGLSELAQYVDTLIIIPNQNLFRIANEKTTYAEALAMADEVLHSGVRGVTDLIVNPGLINLDFADIRTVMSEMGKAMMGTGEAEGEGRAIAAAEAAINNPLLDDVSMKGARAVLVNITGGPDLTLYEFDEAANRIRDEVDPEANIIVGTALEDGLKGRIRVSIVATGIEAAAMQSTGPSAGASDLRVVAGRQNAAMSAAHHVTPTHVTSGLSASGLRMGAPTVSRPAVAATASALSASAAVAQPVMAQSMPAPVPAPMMQPVAHVAPGAAPSLTAGAASGGFILPASPARAAAMGITQRPSAVFGAPMVESGPEEMPEDVVTEETVSSSPAPISPATGGGIPVTRIAEAASSGMEAETPQERSATRRSPSLFERVTGLGRSGKAESPEGPKVSTSPHLGVDPSSRPSLSEGETGSLLDIPTFLRRQTN